MDDERNIGACVATTIRQPRDRLRGHLRSVSIAPPLGATRARLPRTRGVLPLREGPSPNDRDRNRGLGKQRELSPARRAPKGIDG